MLIKARPRHGFVGCILLTSLGLLSACGDDDGEDLDFTAVAGAHCQDCEFCKGIVNSCICKTCTEFAFDSERKQLLVCTGIWTVYKECPGGVSAACSDGAYNISCLDENGQTK